jgi:glycosyltransferase involved in cell wall biosynthesis
LVVSPVEKAILEKACPGVRSYVVPSIHEPHPSPRPFAERQDILFVGSFEHTPNLDAVHYLIEDILPLLRKTDLDARLYIVGGNPPEQIQNLAARDLVITGYVPEIAAYFENCRLSVAPLRFGSGIKVKILASLGYATPVVTTPVGAEGMYLTHGEDILIADNPADFCTRIVELYTDETLWDRVSRNGLALLSRHFSAPAVRATLRGLLEQIE